MDFDLNKSGECGGDDIRKSNGLEDEEFGSAHDIARDIEKRLEVGNNVDGIEQVYVLYCEYARCSGFSVRKGCQKYFDRSSDIRMKEFNCSCEGDPDNSRLRGRVAVYKKQVTRTNCKARIRVVRDRKGPWRISIFEKPHNHELVGPDQSYLLRSARNLTAQKKFILESLCGAGIPVTQACKFMEKESGNRQNCGFIRSDAYAHMRSLKTQSKVENGDANALLQFFIDKSNSDPFFFWKVHLDDDCHLQHFFFRDGRCAVDYECFGDVLSLDTTYKTNRYEMACAPFVGINHHFQNVMFGLAFLSDETTQSFEWLLGAFIESMHGKEPSVIFTDQCQALMNAIDDTLEVASHRLCQWHINQNAPSHFGSLNGDKAFKCLWHHCMNGCDTEEEFEETWQEMINKYNLDENRWFRSMHKLRSRWSSVFTNDRFTAGLHATSRSEVTNRVLKDLGKKSNTLFEFVLHFLEIQDDWRARERAEDALCRGMPGQYVEGNQLLTHVAKLVTRSVYKMFEIEATHSINIRLMVVPEDFSADELLFHVSACSAESRSRVVSFNKSTLDTSCTCRLWETKGVLCRHIFKVYYLMNVDSVPEKYLLKRWRRDAKLRCDHSLTYMHTNSSSHTHQSEILFVNHVLRVVYDMAYESKGSLDLRTRLLDNIYKIRLEQMENRKEKSCLGGQRRKAPADGRFRNPKIAKTRGCHTQNVRCKLSRKNGKLASPAIKKTKAVKSKPIPPSPISVTPPPELNVIHSHPLEFLDSQQSNIPSNSDMWPPRMNSYDSGKNNCSFDDSVPYTWLQL